MERVDLCSIECHGIRSTKIGFYDLVALQRERDKDPAAYDAYKAASNSAVDLSTASSVAISASNSLFVVRSLQSVSHLAPTLKNPHSSRGHTVYSVKVKLVGLEPVHFVCCDLAGSEGQTALGSKDEFVEGLQRAMSRGKLKMTRKQMKGFEAMYKTRSMEAGCINHGLTQLQALFGELIRRRISKSRGLGLRRVLSSLLSLHSAYSVLFTLSFAVTAWHRVETKRAKAMEAHLETV